MKSIKILAINIVLKKLCLNLFKTLSNINPPIHYLMNNKSNSIQKRRIWTDIA